MIAVGEGSLPVASNAQVRCESRLGGLLMSYSAWRDGRCCIVKDRLALAVRAEVWIEQSWRLASP